jgi:uncharacterized membrane protein YGL010W
MKLDATWSDLLARYKDDHQHPTNRATHAIGIPMIVASLPLMVVGAATAAWGGGWVALLGGAALFGVGWVFQFIGHAYEGKKPSFVDDRRSLVVGVIWWAEKMGWLTLETVDPASSARA